MDSVIAVSKWVLLAVICVFQILGIMTGIDAYFKVAVVTTIIYYLLIAVGSSYLLFLLQKFKGAADFSSVLEPVSDLARRSVKVVLIREGCASFVFTLIFACYGYYAICAYIALSTTILATMSATVYKLTKGV